MKRAVLRNGAMVLAMVCAVPSITGCTPKPVSAEPEVELFLTDLVNHEFDAAAARTDQADTVAQVLEQTWNGLQAEGLTAEILDIQARNTIATATYKLNWDLPKDRELSYEAKMTLNKINDAWSIRWQPTALHPKLGANQHLELRAVQAQRASVISSDGAEILVPGVVDRLLVDVTQIGDPNSLAFAIVGALEQAKRIDESVRLLNPHELAEQLRQARGVYSVTTVNKLPGAKVRELLAGKPGVIFNEEGAMVSKDPGFAPDIVSRVATVVNERLDGDNGWRVAAVTHDGALIDDVEYHEPFVAPAVRISLDHKVQQAAEEAVNLRPEMQAVMVALRVSTGEILAVAQTDEADKHGDLAMSGLYPPGSTFKIITAAAGIQDRGLTADSIVPCPGTMNIFGRMVTNYNTFALGDVPLERAFARSCNTTFADISTQLDAGQLQAIGEKFGLGIDYEIPGISSVTGQIPTGETALEKTEAGYGQGLTLVSPFGLALVSATAARGSTPVPSLLSGFDTKVSKTVPPPAPETIEQLRRLMSAVTEPGGTAGGITAGGKIFAKTGEAEINGGSHAWFTGYRDDIAFATLIVLGGGSESAVALTNHFFVRYDELNQ
ncbi:penicillin-binding transpeptidase domain-containing protein [Corynebacterium sp. HS2168-gen11]|uniref:penicillin-binding transpeptidase domain-containing protein n=1 Tax=Corynebacterium sp. HS2168-gen11 TaxID=2974027 RepID=UPI00216AB9CF|nr:penicillin-binding transpeptidase domain-containing protein [Corynebacterium sp. HS2168-gen11]MCS4536307.1 penicillin-binding transpeptidase domain-containing protein [Corynebacterium sp. HS2168-gen11]